jgi:hypothetical protein
MTNPISNLHRAAHAKAALTAFIEEARPCTPVDRMDPEELSDTISDLIADLLHLAGYATLDTRRILTQARTNFHAERVGE